MPATRFHGWFVAATAMVVLLVRLGGPALWDDDEPKNAACSLAMLDSHDWVVPTFNGRLRVEKPPLVNWIQSAGFTLCGRNETGARIGSALLTVGTCLLTWQIGYRLLGPTCGLLGGLAMASCVWTAVGGRAVASLGDAPRGALPVPQAAPVGQNVGGPGIDVEAPADVSGDDSGSSQLVMMPGPAAPQPRTAARPMKSSFLDGALKRFAALWHGLGERIHTASAPRVRDIPAAYAQHPALRALAEQTARVAAIGRDETVLMARTEGALGQGVGTLRNVMRRTGINPDSFARKLASSEGVGGPDIPLDQVRIEGISDPKFTHAYLSAAAVLDQLNGLSSAMDHVPLAMPVSSASFDKTSGFGARVDPFTGRYAFHPGIDFAGPWGSVVKATAPGTVVAAGYRGGYGNMVEIDHGYGIHTRYGHLSAITVRVGSKIGKGGGLGRVGSTGRSTGPHVHYEVWYDDVVKNPNNFIEAGRHVL